MNRDTSLRKVYVAEPLTAGSLSKALAEARDAGVPDDAKVQLNVVNDATRWAYQLGGDKDPQTHLLFEW